MPMHAFLFFSEGKMYFFIQVEPKIHSSSALCIVQKENHQTSLGHNTILGHCALCKEGKETINHMLYSCSFAKEILGDYMDQLTSYERVWRRWSIRGFLKNWK